MQGPAYAEAGSDMAGVALLPPHTQPRTPAERNLKVYLPTIYPLLLTTLPSYHTLTTTYYSLTTTQPLLLTTHSLLLTHYFSLTTTYPLLTTTYPLLHTHHYVPTTAYPLSLTTHSPHLRQVNETSRYHTLWGELVNVRRENDSLGQVVHLMASASDELYACACACALTTTSHYSLLTTQYSRSGSLLRS